MRISRYLLFLFLFNIGQGGMMLKMPETAPLYARAFPHPIAFLIGWGFTLAGLLSLLAFALWAHWIERFLPLWLIRWSRIGCQTLSLAVTSAWLGMGVIESLLLHVNTSATFAVACIVFIEAREIRWPHLTPTHERQVWALLSGGR